MKGPGYIAVIAGKVVHIVKCVPVEVKMEHGESCYAELQVTRDNKTFSMIPRTAGRNDQQPNILQTNLIQQDLLMSGKIHQR